jgi:hypothetical protein
MEKIAVKKAEIQLFIVPEATALPVRYGTIITREPVGASKSMKNQPVGVEDVGTRNHQPAAARPKRMRLRPFISLRLRQRNKKDVERSGNSIGNPAALPVRFTRINAVMDPVNALTHGSEREPPALPPNKTGWTPVIRKTIASKRLVLASILLEGRGPSPIFSGFALPLPPWRHHLH